MREINFRAWDKEKKSMREVTGINWYDEYLWVDETPMSGDKLPIESTPLMQYTGLKDKNGKEIYEGDIVRYDNQNIIVEPPRWYVCDAFCEYGYHNLGSFRRDYDRDDEPSEVIRKGKVIGNIYENPDLLK